jgi:hypothetical protein
MNLIVSELGIVQLIRTYCKELLDAFLSIQTDELIYLNE